MLFGQERRPNALGSGYILFRIQVRAYYYELFYNLAIFGKSTLIRIYTHELD